MSYEELERSIYATYTYFVIISGIALVKWEEANKGVVLDYYNKGTISKSTKDKAISYINNLANKGKK